MNNIRSEYNYSNIDEPNQLLVNGNYSLPKGFAVGTVMRFTSGRPVNAVAGSDLNRDAQNTDRPIVDGVMFLRNAYRNTGFKDVSVRLQKDFALPATRAKLAIIVDFFNLFNFAQRSAGRRGADLRTRNGRSKWRGGRAGAAGHLRQLKNPQGQYYQYNTAGDPFQAKWACGCSSKRQKLKGKKQKSIQ